MSDNFPNDNLPWQQQGDSKKPNESAGKTGVTGHLPWRQELGSNPNAPDEDGLATISWNSAPGQSSGGQPADPTKGLTGMLPWNAQASDPADKPDADQMADWLDANDQQQSQEDFFGDFGDTEEAVYTPPSTPTSVDDTPEWLMGMGDSESESSASGYDFAETPAYTPPSTPTSVDDTPEWLMDMDDSELESGYTNNSPNSQTTPSAPATGFTISSEEESPDWLMGWEDPTPPPAAPVAAPTPTIAADSTPEWLMDMDESEIDGGANDFDAMFQIPSEQEVVDDLFQLPQDENSGGDLPDWLSAIPQAADTPAYEESYETSDDEQAWLEDEQADYQEEIAPQEDLPDWLRGGAASNDSYATSDSGDAPDWLTSADTYAPEDDQEQESASPWLSSDGSEFATGIIPKSVSEAAASELNWLDSYDQDTTAQEKEPQSYEEWLRLNQPDEGDSAEAEQVDSLDWLRNEAANNQDQELTYEEWDRQQQEAEAESRADDIPMPEDVIPDWFLGATGNLPPLPDNLAAQSSDYVPEWFMGVEELDDSDAPEWAKASSGVYKPPSTPLTPPISTVDDIPLPDFTLDGPEIASSPLGLDDLLGDLSDDDLFGTTAPPQTGIKRIESAPLSAPSDSGATDLDDLLFSDPTFDAPADDFDSLFGNTTPPTPPEAPSRGRTEALDKLFPASDSELPGFDDLFGDLVPTDDPTLPLAMPTTGDLALPDFLDMDAFPGFDAAADPMLPMNDDSSPDWLQDFNAAPAELEPASSMDWLGSNEAIELPSNPLPSTDLDALPDWMSDLQSMPSPEPIQAPLDFEAFSLDDAPYELPTTPAEDDYDLDALLGGPPSTPINYPSGSTPSGFESIGDDMLFDDSFLSDLPPAPSATMPALDLDTAILGSDDIALAQEDLPEWMSQVQVSSDQVAVRLGGVEGYFEQISDVALPSDLRDLRQAALQWIGSPSTTPKIVLAEGPLAGVEGALPLAVPVISSNALLLNKTYTPSPEQITRQALLQRLFQEVQAEQQANQADLKYGLESEDVVALEEDLKVAPTKTKAHRKVKRQPARMVVTLLLLVAVLIPFIIDSFQVADAPPITLNAQGLALTAQVDQLTRRQQVLVAFEYGSTAAAELDPLAEAVLRDILAQGGQPIIISSNPIGSLHAQTIAATLNQDPALTKPSTPAILVMPYLAGGPIGVRSLVASESSSATYFSHDVKGNQTDLEIDGLTSDDFAFLMVIADSYEDTRTWAEQMKMLTMPKFALVTAAAESMTRPYQTAGLYNGLLVGQRDTLAYNQVRNTTVTTPVALSDQLPDPTLSSWHSAALGGFVAAFLIIIGAVIHMIGAIRQLRKSK